MYYTLCVGDCIAWRERVRDELDIGLLKHALSNITNDISRTPAVQSPWHVEYLRLSLVASDLSTKARKDVVQGPT